MLLNTDEGEFVQGPGTQVVLYRILHGGILDEIPKGGIALAHGFANWIIGSIWILRLESNLLPIVVMRNQARHRMPKPSDAGGFRKPGIVLVGIKMTVND